MTVAADGEEQGPRPEGAAENGEEAAGAAPRGRRRNSERQQDRIDSRRTQIGAAALELFMSKGYHATTMSEIAELAGISVGLIYHYAPDKEGVLRMVVLDVLNSYMREIPKALAGVEDPLLALRAAITAYCGIVDGSHRTILLGYQEIKSLSAEHRKEVMALELATNGLIADCIQACIDAGYFRPLNVELATYRVIMVAHTWALKYWHWRKRVTLADYVDDNIGAVLLAALSEAGRRHYRELGFALPETQ